jgi:hypothetical protein
MKNIDQSTIDIISQQDEKPVASSPPKTALERFETDKLKGNHNTEEEKKQTKQRNLAYINAYNKKNYFKITINFTSEHKALLDTLAELNNMTVSGYIKTLLEQEKEKYDPKVFEKIYDRQYSIVVKKKALTREEKKQLLLDNILKEAREYFGQDPLTVEKKDRLLYIDKKLNENNKNKDISVNSMCEALEVSRSWYYKVIVKNEQ